jgi:hypothetical protein
MFRRLPFYEHRPETLVALGDTMIQGLENGELDKALGVEDDDENTGTLSGGGLRLPAGYTYFGQFVDHDITFDPVSSLVAQNDPDALTDFRTPRFDLDSVYGRGPDDQPYLYEPGGIKLRLGESRSANPEVAGPDLQRNVDGRALIGDPRNDENLIVSQLQVAMIKFHNKVVDQVQADTQLAGGDLFKLAQQTVRWHYQWVVIHDYLRRLVGIDVVNDILKPQQYLTPLSSPHSVVRPRLLFYHWRKQPFMPVEFSAAAYRFGHSIARPSYLINDVIPVPVVPNAARIPLFSQGGGDLTHLNGFRPLPQEWGVQWKYLLAGVNNAAGPNDAHLPQPSYKLDSELGHPLGALPDSIATAQDLFAGIPATEAQSLAVRNLLRGRALGLPSGQDVARAMGIDPLSDGELFGDVTLTNDARTDLNGHAPLWFYVLKEAQLKADAHRLGAVGGRIVAEVLIGLLDGDPLSYLSVNPTWTPTLPGHTANNFTLTDIINFGL